MQSANGSTPTGESASSQRCFAAAASFAGQKESRSLSASQRYATCSFTSGQNTRTVPAFRVCAYSHEDGTHGARRVGTSAR
jgi:hypothetical protein